ncbi:MAG: enoyl-CoA hydratase/isomerase family protein [Candidatus Velthaea sp.]
MTARVRVAVDGAAGCITLDRPAALNALDLEMFEAVEDALVGWRDDPRVERVVVRGSGRAFSAGGDIRAVRAAAERRDERYLHALYRSEYGANAIISAYPKPYVALVDGVCMGGGMGLAIHGSHRVVTQNALLAMPETAIGFFPDIGCTYVFPRLPHRAGWFLGTTGSRMDAADALWCGLATHFIERGALGECERRLISESSTDGVLSSFAQRAPASSLAEHAGALARCFAGPELRDVLAALSSDPTPWAQETLAMLERMSPSALIVTWALFERGARMTLPECLAMEFYAGRRMIDAPDFAEGVRAAVIDKDRRPVWSPRTFAEVDVAALTAMVDASARDATAPGGTGVLRG